MSLTPSNLLPLGTPAPFFELNDVISKRRFSSDDVKGKNGLVIYFISVHCPYVIHVQNELVKIAHEYLKSDIGFIAISSNDTIKYPADSPENMKDQAETVGFNFPYLFDETQEVAKAYQAACTPDIYVFDAELQCYYRGRLDEATPGNSKPIDGRDLRFALDGLLAGKSIPANQYPSMGCNIKWKS
ncbi:MAG: peroxiredoxin [Cyclobacteriaceae bacterium]|jgi:peroxiredoxin